MIIPVGPSYDDYAEAVKQKLFDAGFMAEVDTDAGDTMNKKIRNAQLAQFNFILGKLTGWKLSSFFAYIFYFSCGRKGT